MIIMGADPGLSGAVAFLDTETGHLDVHDIPTFTLARNGKAKREINTVELARIIDFAAPRLAVIEQVGASPQMGTSSAFAFGQGYGILKGIVSAYFIETKLVPAATWKRVMTRQGTHHNALDDAITQAHAVCEAYRRLGLAKRTGAGAAAAQSPSAEDLI